MRKNRLMCILLVFLVFCSTIVYAADNSTSANDKIVDYNIQTCIDFGFITNSESREIIGDLSKKDFAVIVARLAGYKNISSEDIGQVISQDLIFNEIADTNLSEPITYGAAAKILVCALGYEKMVLYSDPTPMGYIMKANQLGICNGMEGDYSKKITLSDAARMVVNCFDIPYMSVTGVHNADSVYTQNKKSIINVLHNIYKITGILSANKLTGRYSAEGAVLGKIKVGNLVLTTDEPYMDEIGSMVTVYYDNKDDNKVISLINRSEKLTINSEDIVADQSGLKQFVYTDKSDNTRKITLSGKESYIYNGVANPDMTDDLICPKSGTVTFVSSANSSYDTIIVWDYEDLYIRSYDYERKIAMDHNYTEHNIDPENYDAFIACDQDGNKLFTTDIKENRVFSIAKSADGRVLKIIVTRNQIDGYITTIDYGEEIVYIDNVPYKVDETLLSEKSVDFVVGIRGSFWTNYNNEIVYADFDDLGGMEYGYVIAATIRERVSDDVVAIKIYTANGKKEVFECLPEITIDEQRKVSGKDILAALKNAVPVKSSSGNNYNQIIGYVCNPDGNIKEIDTAYKDFPMDGEREDSLKLQHIGNIMMKESQGVVGDLSVGIRSGATVFEVPHIEDGEVEDYYYKVKTASSFAQDEFYNVWVYSPGDKFIGTLVVDVNKVRQSDLAVSHGIENILIVDEFYKCLGPSGEVVEAVQGYNSAGVLKTYTTVRDDILPKGLKKGDILMCTFLSGAYVVASELWYSPHKETNNIVENWPYKNNPGNQNEYDDYNWSTIYAKGTPKDLDGSFVRVVYDNPRWSKWKEFHMNASKFKIILIDLSIDPNKPRISIATYKDIRTEKNFDDKHDVLISAMNSGDPRWMFLVRR